MGTAVRGRGVARGAHLASFLGCSRFQGGGCLWTGEAVAVVVWGAAALGALEAE